MSQNKMNFKTILEFLENKKIKDKLDKNITHTSLGEKSLDIYPAKYRIYKENKEEFYKLYTKWIFTYDEEQHLTEVHNPELCCVLIDLDFRWPAKDGEKRKYNLENIEFLLTKYMFYLDKYLKMFV